MAFGFPASYTTRRELAGNRQTAREAVMRTLELLRWDYEPLDVDKFQATIPMSGASWGERLIVTLAEGEIQVRSECTFLQLFDWGKNKRNVEQFLSHFAMKEFHEIATAPEEPAYIDASGATPVDRMFAAAENSEEDAVKSSKG